MILAKHYIFYQFDIMKSCLDFSDLDLIFKVIVTSFFVMSDCDQNCVWPCYLLT